MKDIAALLQLEENCRNAQDIQELKYLLVNGTRQLLDVSHVLLLSNETSSKLKVKTISDISKVDTHGPFIQWIEEITKRIKKSKKYTSFHEEILDNEFTSSSMLWIPLVKFKKNTTNEFYLLLFTENSFTKDEKDLLKHLSSSYSHFLYALNKVNFTSWFFKKLFSTSFKLFILISLIMLMFLPVKLSVLAPFEIKAKNPLLVSSPLNGTIKDIAVTTNQNILHGDLLFTITNTEYENIYILAKKTLEIAKIKLKTIEQNSFIDPHLKSQIAGAEAEVQLKKSQMNFAKYQYDLTQVHANKSGTIILNNANELLGKPIVIGEKILLIANKHEIELQIMLPVSDAIFLDTQANVKIFFDNDPLQTYHGEIEKIYYEPLLTPQNILSYKIIASFEQEESKHIPKIGLRGTSKIYSTEVSLFFYLFKKPITSLRQWVGW